MSGKSFEDWKKTLQKTTIDKTDKESIQKEGNGSIKGADLAHLRTT